MEGIITRIKASKFLKNVAALMSGKGLEALIGFGCMPLVTRLFSPEEYGLAASLIAIATVLMPLTTLSYENGIVLTKKNQQEIALVRIVIFSSLCWGFLFLFFFWLNRYFGVLNIDAKLDSWLWVVPGYLIIRAVLVCLEQMMIKRNEFKWLAISGVFHVSVAMIIRLIWGFIQGSFAVILIVAYASGILVKIAVCSSRIKDLKKQFQTKVGYQDLFSIARDFEEFPKFQMIGSLFRSAAYNLPIPFLAAIYSPAVAGVYAMTLAISRRPLEMLLASYRTVFIKKGSEIQDNFKFLRQLFLQHTIAIAVLGGFIFLLLFWFSPKVFPWLLGREWTSAGLYIQIITPWLFSLLLSLPAVSMYIIIRKQKIWAQISITTSAIQVLAILSGKYFNFSIETVLWIYSLSGAISCVILVLIVERLLKKKVVI